MQATEWEKAKEVKFENPENPKTIPASPFTGIDSRLGPDGRPIVRVKRFLRNEEYIFPSQNDRVVIRKPGLLDPVDFLIRPFINKSKVDPADYQPLSEKDRPPLSF